jgi:hypothetical protein
MGLFTKYVLLERAKKFIVYMGEEKTNEERRLEEKREGFSPYKCCKVSFVKSPY